MSSGWRTCGKESFLRQCTSEVTHTWQLWVQNVGHTARKRFIVQGYPEAMHHRRDSPCIHCVLWPKDRLGETTRAPWDGLPWPHECCLGPVARVKMVGSNGISSIWDFLGTCVGLNLKAKLSIRADQNRSWWQYPAPIVARITSSSSLNSKWCILRGFACISFSRIDRRRNQNVCLVWNKETYFHLLYDHSQGTQVRHK